MRARSVLTAFTLTIPERASCGAAEVRGHAEFTSVHHGNTNRWAWLCADHKFSNLAALFPAKRGPGTCSINP
jgi:hypothetical protein